MIDVGRRFIYIFKYSYPFCSILSVIFEPAVAATAIAAMPATRRSSRRSSSKATTSPVKKKKAPAKKTTKAKARAKTPAKKKKKKAKEPAPEADDAPNFVVDKILEVRKKQASHSLWRHRSARDAKVLGAVPSKSSAANPLTVHASAPDARAERSWSLHGQGEGKHDFSFDNPLRNRE